MEYSPTVIVPQSTKSLMVKKLVEEGAKMVQTGQTWFETDSQLRKEILGHDLNGAYALDYTLQPQAHNLVVSDKEAIQAYLCFLDDERLWVEPAYGATLAMAYTEKLKEILELKEDNKVVLVACEGPNISLSFRNLY
nr:hypothetical protein L204_04178 [Cryptococcus depauperatus CBS 7855]